MIFALSLIHTPFLLSHYLNFVNRFVFFLLYTLLYVPLKFLFMKTWPCYIVP